MQVINSKKQIALIAAQLQQLNLSWSSLECTSFIHTHILKKKIRFPALEHFAVTVFPFIPKKERGAFLQNIINLDEIGSYAIAGKFLQLQFIENIKQIPSSFKLAEKFIIQGDKWYVCDIIGERVFGYALLKFSENTFPYLKKFKSAKNNWVTRSIGVATHYATKKGLDKQHAENMFVLLLSLSASTDFHIKKGIGWGAKTIAKFHPAIIKKYDKEIYQNEDVRTWFKPKIKIGLGRSNKYASKYNG